MIHTTGDVAALRTRLRAVNIEYSALIRRSAEAGRPARLAELRAQRHVLMAQIAMHSGVFLDQAGARAGLRPASVGARSFTGDIVSWLRRLRKRSLLHSLRGTPLSQGAGPAGQARAGDWDWPRAEGRASP